MMQKILHKLLMFIVIWVFMNFPVYWGFYSFIDSYHSGSPPTKVLGVVSAILTLLTMLLVNGGKDEKEKHNKKG
jgi:hypothetical protein